MKKRIALLANGWNNEYLRSIIRGITKCLEKENIDTFMFLNYASYGEAPEKNRGEFNIFNLVNLRDFEGIIMLSNCLNSEETVEVLRQRIVESHVPAISFEGQLEGIDYIVTDNYAGMFELTEHLITSHNIRNAVFYGGPENNAESRERLHAVMDALKSSRIALPEENIFWGTWTYSSALTFAEQFASSGREMPDAFICANDSSAMGVIAGLRRYDIHVPEDVLVTGFDNIEEGRIYNPTITSVDRSWEALGYKGCQHLILKMQGFERPVTEKLATHLRIGESCGCRLSDTEYSMIRKHCSGAFDRSMNSIIFSQSISDMENDLANTPNIADLPKTIDNYFSRHSFLGSEMYILGEPGFGRNIIRNDSHMLNTGYSDVMKVVLAVKDGVPFQCREFHSCELIPGYSGCEGESHFYTFCPIHYREISFGYIVFRDNLLLIEDTNLYNWTDRVNQNLEQFRQNKRLDVLNRQLMELYMQDSLSGLYNRFAISSLAEPLLSKLCNEGHDSVILFADINRMKKINDMYGHLQGDLAIRAVANAVRNSIPEDWVAIRYGGDEFLALGRCDDESSAESIKADIDKALKSMAVKMSLPYDLTVSIGHEMIEHSSSNTLTDYINTADEKMYRRKQEMHNSD